MLKYDCKAPKETLFYGQPNSSDVYETLYDPPVSDFSVSAIKVIVNCLA